MQYAVMPRLETQATIDASLALADFWGMSNVVRVQRVSAPKSVYHVGEHCIHSIQTGVNTVNMSLQYERAVCDRLPI